MTILLNTCLAVDLILMIKYPFKNKDQRVPVYLVVSFCVSATVTISSVVSANYLPKYDYFLPDLTNMLISIIILAANYIISYASIIYAFKKLCKPGISKESQRLVLLRHVLSIIGFTLTQIYPMLGYVYMASPTWYFSDKQDRLATVFKVLWQTQGIYLSLIRTSEPFFFEVVFNNIQSAVLAVFCCRKTKEEQIDSKSLERDLFDDNELEQLADEYNQIRRTMSQLM